MRHGLVSSQQQNHKRKYRRWQRDAPMQLWQIDIMGGVFLADGRECKLVTGIRPGRAPEIRSMKTLNDSTSWATTYSRECYRRAERSGPARGTRRRGNETVGLGRRSRA